MDFLFMRCHQRSMQQNEILLDLKIDDRKICKQRPLNIESSSTFVIDSLKDPDDVKKDKFNIIMDLITRPLNAVSVPVEMCGLAFFSPPNAQWEQYYLRRLHSKHPTNCRFKQMLCFITRI